MRQAHWRLTGAAFLGLAGAACSAILGLEAPPDALPSADAGPPPADGAPVDAGPPPVCASLDAVTDAGGSYSSIAFDDAGTGAWDWFDTTAISSAHPTSFAGGTFDGRFVYFAGRGGDIAQYDTMGASFDAPASWAYYGTGTGGPEGFSGALFDGRYVYFIPYLDVVPQSRILRYDSAGAFTSAASWSSFDLLALSADGGAATSGFVGGGFDGRYLYLVPHADGAPDGRVVRYDTVEPDAGVADAGHSGDAGGDAGHSGDAGGDAGEDAGEDAGPGDFGELDRWATFDVSTVNPLATGFSGAAFDGTSLYLAPTSNGGPIDKGFSAIAARLQTDGGGGFKSDAGWSTYDLTNVNGLAFNFVGAGFDGRYVYFAPRGNQVVVRFDTTVKQFNSATAWTSRDLASVLPPAQPDAAALPAYYAGVGFDGRFVYLIPAGTGFATVVRYDTLSTFFADCAWSTVDLTQIDAGGVVPQNYNGAVFDGQYLYLVPNSGGIVARFNARTPGLLPSLPAFHGSFW